MPVKLAIAGTRGIPNQYGGFEQCAEYLSTILADMNYDVTVYNAHDHNHSENKLGKVNIVHIYNPEKTIGTAGNFIYDYRCMRHAVKNKFDILLMLGYTTASVFYPRFNFNKTILVTNMDGLEWKRDKWNTAVKKLAKWFEQLAAKNSHHLVSDNEEIRNYLSRTYRRDSEFIPYGCTSFRNPDEKIIHQYGVDVGTYGIIVARMEAENNIDMMLKGFMDSNQQCKMLVVGNTITGYGKKMKAKYSKDPRIIFTEGIYNLEALNNLRHYSRYYLHGHSVGGTNPALTGGNGFGSIYHGAWKRVQPVGTFIRRLLFQFSPGAHRSVRSIGLFPA
jgi:hypothetical protein